MLIGLLSDTHVRTPGFNAGLSSLTADELPAAVCEALQGVDLILHAGDIYTLPVLDELEAVAPVLAAEGDEVVVSSRPSDAIALAARTGSPLFVDPLVLEEAGVEIHDEDEEAEVERFRDFLENVTPEDFGTPG